MFMTAIAFVAAFIRRYLHEISFGITAVSLMLAGPHINGSVRRLVKKMHWLVRYSAFVLLCTVGYVFLAHIVYEGVKNLLGGCKNPVLVLVTVAVYLLLAWIAKEQKAI